jgi:hypothetical protein
MARTRYGNRHNHIYDVKIVNYLVKEMIWPRILYANHTPLSSSPSRQPQSETRIWKAIQADGCPKADRGTIRRHIKKLVKERELMNYSTENDKHEGRQYNETSYGLVLYSIKIRLPYVIEPVSHSSSPDPL